VILRLPEVQKRVGLRKSAIYSGLKDGSFPKPIKLGTGPHCAVGWLEPEINSWLKARIAERDGCRKAAA
jgi:prophage regulatory protein